MLEFLRFLKVMELLSFSLEIWIGAFISPLHTNAAVTNTKHGIAGTCVKTHKTTLTGNKCKKPNAKLNTRIILPASTVLIICTQSFVSLDASQSPSVPRPLHISKTT